MVTDWHDDAATNTCVTVETLIENRSDTPVNTLTLHFQTLYTPKHPPGTYPDEVNGPMKTLQQVLGVAAYQSRRVYWDVCAPEMASLQNPPPTDGTDAFMSEIEAQPMSFTWQWAAQS